MSPSLRTILGCLALAVALPVLAAKPGGIKCKLEKVMDDEKSGLAAFVYLVPDGWVAHHKFGWGQYDAYNANLSAGTPDKQYIVDVLEPTFMNYTETPNAPPKGIVINHATDFLKAMANGIVQQSGYEDAQVVDEVNETLPPTEYQKMSDSKNWGPLQTRASLHESGYLKLSFKANGVEETAQFGTTIVGTITSMHMLNNPSQQTMQGGQIKAGPTLVIITPANATPAKVKETLLVASSMRMTPQFFQYRAKLTTALAKGYLEGTAAAQREHDANWHQKAMADFRNQMAAKDENTHQFCNYIQDQQDYQSRNGTVVTLPDSYKYVWEDQTGNYLLTDNPTTDPRGLGSGDWKEMAKYRPGN